ncbi:hypothetical protein AAFN85_25075 [Mucilaginibacter sp. CAU 1740]|uniref:hypothetical protein n=1 Tax=Mucilaginibacter sp. CAU 1740 TaxID=3140365 RepID=UPI00325B90AC
MKYLRFLALLIPISFACIEKDQAQSKLENTPTTIIVSYGYVGCTCAQWVINDDRLNTTKAEYIYLEQGNKKLIKADDLPDGLHSMRIKVTGYFYKEKGFPRNYTPAKGDPEPARVFRYSKIQKVKVKGANG